ncbi:unnamed protein product [Scytosiphon promiscuus]
MFDDVISTGLQAVLTEVFESVDKNQLNVSLVGDIFKESHLELTDLRLKKTLLKDMNLPVEVKEGLVGKLVIQGLSGVMTGDPVTVTISEVLLLLTPGSTLSDPEAGLAARRMAAALREMFANRYAEDFLEDALGVKAEDKMSVQSQNKLNRKLLRHIVRKVLAGVSIILQAVHVRFELPAGGLDGATPVKASGGVGGGGACDAVGVMLPSLTVRTCTSDHPSFSKFSAQTPLDRVGNPNTSGGSGSGATRGSPQKESAATMARREQEAKQGDRKNFVIVRKRATAANLQVYCDYGVDSYVTAIGSAVSSARNKATNPRPGTSGSLPGGNASSATSSPGAAAAAKAVRALFLQKWKSERHALLFKPLALEVGAEVHQWDQPGGKAIAPTYKVERVNVGVGELQAVVDSEQARVVGTVIDEIVNLVRRARFNRFVPQAYLPLRNLPPPKVLPPKPYKDGTPGGMLPTVETWSWADERGGKPGMPRPNSVSEAILRGGFPKEGGAWARAMWRFAGACVRHDVRSALTKRLPKTLPNWDGTVSDGPCSSPPAPAADNGVHPESSGAAADAAAAAANSWRVAYLRLHARLLPSREAKSLSSSGGGHRMVDVRRLGVPKGREPLSLEEMWDVAKVESYAPGDEVVFLRTAAKVSSHYEWNRARRTRNAAKAAAAQAGASPQAAAAAAAKAMEAAAWTAGDDAAVLRSLDELRARRAAAAAAAAAADAEDAIPAEEEEEDEEDISKMHFAATATTSGFSDDDDDSDSESDEDSDSEDDSDEDSGPATNGGGSGTRFTLADIAAKAKEAVSSSSTGTPQKGGAAGLGGSTPGRKSGGAVLGGGKAAKLWSRLLGLPRVVFQMESAGIELRTRIAGGARRPLVALSASGLTGTLEGDEGKKVLWWELRVGNLTLRDLCSSWGNDTKKGAAAAPVAKTLMSGAASGLDGRQWVSGGDTTGAASRSFLVVRVVYDPNRAACALFSTSAAAMAQLRTHVVLGCVTGKVPPQVLAVFNAAARDIVERKTAAGTTASRSRVSKNGNEGGEETAARQLRLTLGSVFRALVGSRSVVFRPKKRKGPSAAVRALSMARGATSSSSGEVDSRELYRVVAGILPGDFEVRVHTSEVIVQVSSRAEDLLEAGKVALEAIGEKNAAADMKGGSAASESIDLEVDVAPMKVDACRSSQPSPEFWIDTGIMRTKLRAPEKAVEAVVTALLTSAQRTTAAVALLSGSAPPLEDQEDDGA